MCQHKALRTWLRDEEAKLIGGPASRIKRGAYEEAGGGGLGTANGDRLTISTRKCRVIIRQISHQKQVNLAG
jgi:hypothetical protein